MIMTGEREGGEKKQSADQSADSYFLKRSVFGEGEKIDVGTTFFDELSFYFKEIDFKELRKMVEEMLANPASEFSGEDIILLQTLVKSGKLHEDEAKIILVLWRVLEKYNGGELTHGELKAKERVDMYLRADRSRKFVPVGLKDFKGKQFMECVEIATVVHDAVAHTDAKNQSYAIRGLVYHEDGTTEPHMFNVLALNGSVRFMLVDMSYHVARQNTDDKISRIPFVALLEPDQLQNLQAGQRFDVTFLDVSHSYRVGTPHTPSGTFKVRLE